MILFTKLSRVAFQIDESDLYTVSQFYWHIHLGYVATSIRIIPRADHLRPRNQYGQFLESCVNGGKQIQRKLLLQRFLLRDIPIGFHIDHINRDKLDNRRGNLRVVTPSVNCRNSNTSTLNTSGVKGVTKSGKGWLVRITTDSGRLTIGTFKTLELAAAARIDAEKKYWKPIDRIYSG